MELETKEQSLSYHWTKYLHIPGSKIKNYFGEKIALYFTFLGLYTKYLMGTGIVGIILFILQQTLREDSDSEQNKTIAVLNAIFCMLTIAWTTVFLEHWKRKESECQVLWGQTDFESDEVPRPTFMGIPRRSPITDEPNELWYSPMKRGLKILGGFLVSAFIISCVIGSVVSILYLRR
jgi:anoctamin-10